MTDTIPRTLDLESIENYRYDYACDTLTAMLNDINPDGDQYTSRGQNVGWRNQNGNVTVTIKNGRDLLQKLTPNGDWRLSATLTDDALRLELSHHDSPTGELHTLTPV